MVLFFTEVNCTLLKERLKCDQNCTENQPLRTPDGLISRARLEKGRWSLNFGILHRSTWRLCVPILSKIGWPSFPSLPRSLRQKLLRPTCDPTWILKRPKTLFMGYTSLIPCQSQLWCEKGNLSVKIDFCSEKVIFEGFKNSFYLQLKFLGM